MALNLIGFALLGFFAYWFSKVPATLKDDSPISTVRDFFKANWKEFVLSVVGLVLLCFGGSDIPEDWGKIDGPITAFIAGGSIPSMFMNVMAAWFKK